MNINEIIESALNQTTADGRKMTSLAIIGSLPDSTPIFGWASTEMSPQEAEKYRQLHNELEIASRNLVFTTPKE